MPFLEASVLKYIRDHAGISARQLVDAFQVPYERPTASDVVGRVYLQEVLRNLRNVNLVSCNGTGMDAVYEIAGWWADVQRVLNISLSDLARRQSGVSMVVQPIFGLPGAASAGRSAFIVMPFSRSLEPVYDTIQEIVLRCGYVPVRADGMSSRQSASVVQDVWSGLHAAQLVIADCSNKNCNVAYEVGIAHTLGKQVLLLSQKEEDVPFDIRHLRVLMYEATTTGLRTLRLELKKCLVGSAEAAG